MNAKRTWRRIVRTGLAIGLTTTVMGGGCSTRELDALVAGVAAAADRLDRADRGNNNNFGDWLADGIDGLNL